MTREPPLTLAIPTFNRAELVENAVRSLMQQSNTSRRWRVLVVDNRSTDETAARLTALAGIWPRLDVVREEKQGPSHARNRALAGANEGWVLFADDECQFPHDYVDRALSIIDERRPAMFGGPIRPWYRGSSPKWWRDEYGSFSLPQGARRANRIYLSGGNMGFSVEALNSIGGFNPDFGMIGQRVSFGEETDVESRILSKFGPQSVWYDAEFVNYHLVRPEKYRWMPLLREHFRRGVSRAKVAQGLARSSAQEPAVVPECLKPRPRVRARAYHPQALAYELGLPLVRQLGVVVGRLSG